VEEEQGAVLQADGKVTEEMPVGLTAFVMPILGMFGDWFAWLLTGKQAGGSYLRSFTPGDR